MLKGSEEEARQRMMCRRLLLCIGFLSLLLPALVTASERKYPPEMPTLGDRPMDFVKDREGNVVHGSWEHIEKARERCHSNGEIVVEVVLFHQGLFEEAAEFVARQEVFIESLESMGLEVEVVDRSKLGPILFLRVDERVLDVLITHPMVSRVFDTGQLEFELDVEDSVSVIGADVLHSILPFGFKGQGGEIAILDTGVKKSQLPSGTVKAEACFLVNGGCPGGATELPALSSSATTSPDISPYRELKGKTTWVKIKNPEYSQADGRRDLFNAPRRVDKRDTPQKRRKR